MGKPTSFIEYIRELPSELVLSDRIRKWNEFHQHPYRHQLPLIIVDTEVEEIWQWIN